MKTLEKVSWLSLMATLSISNCPPELTDVRDLTHEQLEGFYPPNSISQPEAPNVPAVQPDQPIYWEIKPMREMPDGSLGSL